MPFPGDRLKERRELLGLTLQELADQIGKTKAYISHLETGVKSNPAYEVLEALCKVLKVPGGFFSVEAPTPADSPAEVKSPRGRGRPPKSGE